MKCRKWSISCNKLLSFTWVETGLFRNKIHISFGMQNERRYDFNCSCFLLDSPLLGFERERACRGCRCRRWERKEAGCGGKFGLDEIKSWHCANKIEMDLSVVFHKVGSEVGLMHIRLNEGWLTFLGEDRFLDYRKDRGINEHGKASRCNFSRCERSKQVPV